MCFAKRTIKHNINRVVLGGRIIEDLREEIRLGMRVYDRVPGVIGII